jgi:hypothetical protein
MTSARIEGIDLEGCVSDTAFWFDKSELDPFREGLTPPGQRYWGRSGDEDEWLVDLFALIRSLLSGH